MSLNWQKNVSPFSKWGLFPLQVFTKLVLVATLQVYKTKDTWSGTFYLCYEFPLQTPFFVWYFSSHIHFSLATVYNRRGEKPTTTYFFFNFNKKCYYMKILKVQKEENINKMSKCKSVSWESYREIKDNTSLISKKLKPPCTGPFALSKGFRWATMGAWLFYLHLITTITDGVNK